MKAQAHSLRPALSCIVRRMKAVRSRFCETGAGVAYLTPHRGLRPSIAPSRLRLYGLYLLGLKSLVSVKATDTGLRNLNILADNRLGESQSGFLCALGMSELYRVKVPKCGRWRQAHSQRQGLNREVPTEGSPRQTIDLTNRNGLRHMLSGKTA